MKWAFWRRGEEGQVPAGRDGARRAAQSVADDIDPGRADPAAALRVRARRRLIGAAALLLAAVIVVPMVLDPTPRPVPDSVPIDVPSEKTPFKPRLPLPPVPDPGAMPVPQSPEPTAPDAAAPKDEAPAASPAPPAAAATKADAAAKSAPKAAAAAADKVPARTEAETQKLAEAQRARDLLEGRTAATAAKSGGDDKYYVQAAALRSERAASDLAAKLKKAGLPSFTERVQASDGTRWRVRAGPYATRQEAERARARLRELGTGADLIAP